MDPSPLLSKLTVPVLSRRENAGLQDYWRIYERHREEIEAELLRMISTIPQLMADLQNVDLKNSPEQQANIVRQRRAIYENDWEPFLSSLATTERQ